MSDRIVVMKEGHVTGKLETAKTTQEEILNAAMVVDIPAAEPALVTGNEG